MPKRTTSYEADLHERLRDPEYAVAYLRAALEDDDEGADDVFLLSLSDVAKANHMAYVAEATGLNRESLYKMLSKSGNPGVNSLKAVLRAVGLKLSVEALPAAKACHSFEVELPILRSTATARGLRSGEGDIRSAPQRSKKSRSASDEYAYAA